MSSRYACVILAAGLGTRMKSPLPKVLHPVCGIPMLRHVVAAAVSLKPDRIVVVTGIANEAIREAVGDMKVSCAIQHEPKGTGHALQSAVPALKGFSGTVIVLNGDAPLVTSGTLRTFLKAHRRVKNDLSVLSFSAADPSGYGRIVRTPGGRMAAIVEERDADASQKEIGEVNSGIYALGTQILPLLRSIRRNPLKGEYYLTDLVSLSVLKGRKADAFNIGAEDEFMGVNTRGELQKAEAVMRRRMVARWTEEGVHFLDPDSVFLHPSVSIGAETTIYPNVQLEEGTTIGRHARIHANSRITGSRIGDGAVVKDCTVIEDSEVHDNASVGPFAHLRPGSIVGSRARIGNFVELKKAVIGEGTKASHLSYLGDARIGRDVNIGAGTITCNYDGSRKSLTVIEDEVFVGSDTQLVAPVTVGRGAYVGAGTTVTRDVPAEALAVSRTEQRNFPGWAKKRRRATPKDKAENTRKD